VTGVQTCALPICPLETASWDAWDAVRPDALAFRQWAGRDADAGKLAGRAPDVRELDGPHQDLQRQIDRRRDAARLRAQDELAPGRPGAVLSAAQSCAGRVADVVQSACREPEAALSERLAPQLAARQIAQPVAALRAALLQG